MLDCYQAFYMEAEEKYLKYPNDEDDCAYHQHHKTKKNAIRRLAGRESKRTRISSSARLKGKICNNRGTALADAIQCSACRLTAYPSIQHFD